VWTPGTSPPDYVVRSLTARVEKALKQHAMFQFHSTVNRYNLNSSYLSESAVHYSLNTVHCIVRLNRCVKIWDFKNIVI
jgi:hypothetical protein